ncbi:MAG: DUF3501 family protein [Burkholderiales bacterium]|jgi:hypothetical protein|nr:DUF3501 family protein [Burkholderiales bacterium]
MTMPHISQDSLMPLETYARVRPEFRARVIAHKKDRAIQLGANVTLIFEDELTIRYQIQEMLRAEKIFEQAGIIDELGAYNPLIPDGSNWKATMMIEYPEENERRIKLGQLIGVEDRAWVQVQGCDRVYAIADEDLERDNGQKTSAVHFLRFELAAAMVAALRGGAVLGMGVDHPNYSATVARVPDAMRASLLADLA